jgi:RNA polymerase sigma factor (sigma-70 family)
MSLFKPKSADSWTRERLFAEKYDWLLGYALRLAHGDHATAEDLVQDTFVSFILAETELKSTENIEPLLYTYLKFSHLAHLRRLQRYPAEPLPLANYDFLELALRTNKSIAERVEVQNTLRRIVAYLCWRKESAKSSSLLILRYFHAYYPDEIARIARTPRMSVDKRLQEGRREASLYASSPGRLRIMHQSRSGATHIKPPVI